MECRWGGSTPGALQYAMALAFVMRASVECSSILVGSGPGHVQKTIFHPVMVALCVALPRTTMCE
jgi:hypothetical protein